MTQILPGINIQWPWSSLLVSGEKTVETRSYPLPTKYIGKQLAIIETPGPHGKRDAGIDSARIIGVIVFSGSKKYSSKATWKKDHSKHLVAEDDPLFAFDSKKEKWGWVVESVRKLDHPLPAPEKRGIVFATCCHIPS